MAAKINKFRKVLKKAGEFVEPTKGFDPEEYAKKLTKMEDPIGNTAFVERRRWKSTLERKFYEMTTTTTATEKRTKNEKREKKTTRTTRLRKNTEASREKRKTNKKNALELRTSGKCSKRNPNETALKRSERKGKKKFQEVQKIRDAKRKERGKLRHSMMKVNRKGQPLMKNRIDAILAKLEKK